MANEPAASCRDVSVLLDDYLDGDLPFATKARVEAHWAGCVRCLTYFAGYRETVLLVRAALSARDGGETRMPEALVRAVVADGEASA